MNDCRLGSQDKEASCKAVCCHKMGARFRDSSKLHGRSFQGTSNDTQMFIWSQSITAFLMNQNQQFESIIGGLTCSRVSLDPARWGYWWFIRLQNHDLLILLDVLTLGTYKCLLTGIKLNKVTLCLPVLSSWTHGIECRNLSSPFHPWVMLK